MEKNKNKEKKDFIFPTVEVITYKSEDIIATSGNYHPHDRFHWH